MAIDFSNPDTREETYGRTLSTMRWHNGKLQMGFRVKYSLFAGRRLVESGERIEWEDVPGEMPFAEPPQ